MNGSRWAGRPRHTAQLSLTVIIVLLIAACSSPAAEPASPTEEPTPSPTVAATPEPTPTEEPTATPEPSPTEDPTPGIGSQVQVGDEQYVTVTDVEPWPGNDTQEPGADNVFVAVNIRVDAIETTSFTSEDFSVEDSDGTSYAEAAPGRSPHLSFQNGLTPNTYYAGYVTFEVPADAADDLVLVYAPNFFEETYEIELD